MQNAPYPINLWLFKIIFNKTKLKKYKKIKFNNMNI